MGVSKAKKTFFIGGSEIYKVALGLVDSIHLTLVDTSSIGDTLFPRFNMADWMVLFETRYWADAKNECDFTIKKLVRKMPKG